MCGGPNYGFVYLRNSQDEFPVPNKIINIEKFRKLGFMFRKCTESEIKSVGIRHVMAKFPVGLSLVQRNSHIFDIKYGERVLGELVRNCNGSFIRLYRNKKLEDKSFMNPRDFYFGENIRLTFCILCVTADTCLEKEAVTTSDHWISAIDDARKICKKFNISESEFIVRGVNFKKNGFQEDTPINRAIRKYMNQE